MAGKERFEGKSLSDALDRAASRFGTDRDSISYLVVKESQGGFFGLLGGKVIIEAWPKNAQAPAGPVPSGGPAAEPVSEDDDNRGNVAAAGDSFTQKQDEGRNRRRRRRHGRHGGSPDGRQQQQKRDNGAKAAAQEAVSEPRARAMEPVSVRAEVEAFMAGVLGALGEGSTMAVEEDGEQALVRITINRDSIFASREFHTIDAIKTLLDKAINKGPIMRKRVRIQVCDQTAAESPEMRGIGESLGRKAVALNKPISIKGLSAQDRKAIHTALAGDRSLKTVSAGDGAFRKLYLVPNAAREPVVRDLPEDVEE